jgi:cobalt-zinc-cadmium efflux system membrane fusion protein
MKTSALTQVTMMRTTTSLVATILLVLSLTACNNSEPSTARTPAAQTKDEHAGEGHEEGEESHEEGGGDHVKLTPEQIKSAGIGLAQAGPANVREHLPLYGVIAPNAERVLEVGARFPGVIRTVTRRVGDSVRRGETLATVESNESLQTYAVVAPLTGVVTARNANPGEQAGDKALFTVADLSTVWVELSVFPRDIAKVRVGQVAHVKSADTGLSAEGKVVYVAPFGSTTNQTLSARVLLDNADRKWPPGLYVTAEVTLTNTAVPLAISSGALQTMEERTVVFVQGEEGFEPRAVQLGRSDGEVTEVLAGLEPGDTYATRNSFILKAELGKGEAEHGH